MISVFILNALLSSNNVFAQSKMFYYAGTLPSGDGPSDVGVGDLNNDGKPDLTVANRASGSVTVLLGDGKGGFSEAPGSPFASGPTSNSPVLGDFNGDGNPDIAVANDSVQFPVGSGTFQVTNAITLLLGDGTGRFSRASGTPVKVGSGASRASAMAAGDLNRDGKLDLLIYTGGLAVLLGDGMGGFQVTHPFLGGFGYTSLVLADVNRDGKLDLVAVNADTPNVDGVFLGDGAGKFVDPRVSLLVSGGNYNYSVAAGDFTGDGKQSLLTASTYSTGNVILWTLDPSLVYPTYTPSYISLIVSGMPASVT